MKCWYHYFRLAKIVDPLRRRIRVRVVPVSLFWTSISNSTSSSRGFNSFLCVFSLILSLVEVKTTTGAHFYGSACLLINWYTLHKLTLLDSASFLFIKSRTFCFWWEITSRLKILWYSTWYFLITSEIFPSKSSWVYPTRPIVSQKTVFVIETIWMCSEEQHFFFILNMRVNNLTHALREVNYAIISTVIYSQIFIIHIKIIYVMTVFR